MHLTICTPLQITDNERRRNWDVVHNAIKHLTYRDDVDWIACGPAPEREGVIHIDVNDWTRSRAKNECTRVANPVTTHYCFLDADVLMDNWLSHIRMCQYYDVYSPSLSLYKLGPSKTVNRLSGVTYNWDKPLGFPAIEKLLFAAVSFISKEAFERIGGWDERFIGYGYEDTAMDAFARAGNFTIGTGNAKVIHLWHPPKKPNVNRSLRFFTKNYQNIRKAYVKRGLPVPLEFIEHWHRAPSLPPEIITKTSDKCVLTYIHGKEAESLSKTSLPLLEAFAKKCNADMQVMRGDDSPGNFLMNKFKIRDYIDAYDRVCYIDIDAYVKAETPNLFTMLPAGYFYAHDDMPHCPQWWVDLRSEWETLQRSQRCNVNYDVMLNTGVMMLDKSCRDAFEMPAYPYPNNRLTEQFWVTYNVISKRIPYRLLDSSLNSQRYFPNWADLRNKSYILHLAGEKNKSFDGLELYASTDNQILYHESPSEKSMAHKKQASITVQPDNKDVVLEVLNDCECKVTEKNQNTLIIEADSDKIAEICEKARTAKSEPVEIDDDDDDDDDDVIETTESADEQS